MIRALRLTATLGSICFVVGVIEIVRLWRHP